MKKIVLVLFVLLISLPLNLAGAASSASDQYIKAYDYSIPASYTIKSIDTDDLGNLYYTALIDTTHAKLVAISPSGKTKWTVNTPAGKDLYVMTDYANNVYASTGSKLISYKVDGSVNWTKDMGTSSFSTSKGKDAVVVFTSERMWAYDYSGKKLYDVNYAGEDKVGVPDFGYGIWTKTLQGNDKYSIDVYKGAKKLFTVNSPNGQPIGLAELSPDGKTVYMRDTVKRPGQSGSIFAFNTDGSLKWSYNVGEMKWVSDMQILDSGSIVFSHAAGTKLSALSSDGKFIWSGAEKNANTPLGTIKNTIYFGNDVYDQNGNLILSISNPEKSGYIIAGDGSILLTKPNQITRMVLK